MPGTESTAVNETDLLLPPGADNPVGKGTMNNRCFTRGISTPEQGVVKKGPPLPCREAGKVT